MERSVQIRHSCRISSRSDRESNRRFATISEPADRECNSGAGSEIDGAKDLSVRERAVRTAEMTAPPRRILDEILKPIREPIL